MDADSRPTPDALLRHLNEQADRQRRGRLKIFFGYAAGVGKTYAMLDAAHSAQKAGVEVVAGYIEPHTRPETMALLDGLPQLPPQSVTHRGITLHEFDLDAALARHPQLLLVDELAHTNAAGCRHRKRYQDVEELLRAGIDVYTTVNVQHIESLNDIVASITGVVVRERLPDSVFDEADQVELVDIEPDDLIDRLDRGKIYQPQQAERALGNFFTRDNLVALREIALRRTADRVNKAAEKAKPPAGKADFYTGEHILICLSSSPSNAKVIRTAARMADAFHGAFTALFVQTPGTQELKGDNLARLRENLKLAEQLGARIATVYGEDVPAQIAEYARVSGVSKIVIGRSNTVRRFWSGPQGVVQRLTALAPNLDVYIIPDAASPYRPTRHPAPLLGEFWVADCCRSLAILAAVSLISLWFYHLGFSEANIITVYILGVLCTAIATTGKLYSAATSVLSVLVFNYLFTEPRFTLQAYDTGYPVTFLIMLLASLLVSTLTTQVKEQARQSARKAYRTEVLLETSQKLQRCQDWQSLLKESATQMMKLLDCTVLLYPAREGELQTPMAFSPNPHIDTSGYTAPDEQAVAHWVFKNNKHAGATTNTLPGAKCLYLAVRGKDSVFAVAAIAMDGRPELDAFDKNLLIAMLGECGLALEKEALNETKNKIALQAEQDQLRANLLRAISHDLRTPLTSISGNAGILMGNASVLDDEKRRQLYADIYDDSIWLIDLVENLLSVTRIENGSMDIELQPELLDEVIQEALRHVNRKSREHTITLDLPDDMVMARMDSRLIVQVIINIVNNAIKYTPVGSHITVSAKRAGPMVQVEIADDGPGVSDRAKARLFDMFYTADNQRGDGRRGIGLGLSLCKSIVAAHGGRIGVRDNDPKGTVFYFTLQSEEVDCHE